MCDGDGHPGLIGKPLQLGLPWSNPHAIAAAAIGPDQELFGSRIAGLPRFLPPATDALHRERGGIMSDTEIDPTGIGSNVVDTVGRDLA
jgi:hypothetical protein